MITQKRIEQGKREYKAKIGKCEKCARDLSDANHWESAVCYRDGNPGNNSESNYIVLCKRCCLLRNKSS